MSILKDTFKLVSKFRENKRINNGNDILKKMAKTYYTCGKPFFEYNGKPCLGIEFEEGRLFLEMSDAGTYRWHLENSSFGRSDIHDAVEKLLDNNPR